MAAVFIFINYGWIALSVEGGSEPLFMCLLYASFLGVRSTRWKTAALLASLSTTVRPVGVFALLAFAVVLVSRRNYRKLAVITVIGVAIGVLYVVPLWTLLGNPFENFIAYREVSGLGLDGWWLTFPFVHLVREYLGSLHSERWALLVLPPIWLAAAMVGVVLMWLPRHRQRFSPYRPEALFASIYMLFLASFNAYQVGLNLPRFLLPILPLCLFALRDWIPRARAVLWAGAVVSALLSAAARVGLENILQFHSP